MEPHSVVNLGNVAFLAGLADDLVLHDPFVWLLSLTH
jgi:hypothetical protein